MPGIRHFIVHRHTQSDRLGAEFAFALFQRWVPIGAQHQQKMRLPRIFLLHAQRRCHQVVEHLGFGATEKRRQIQMHHQRIGLAAAADDLEYLFRHATVFLLQRADRAIHRIGDAGARRQLQFCQRCNGSCVKWRYIKPEPGEVIGGQHTCTAAVAEQGDALRRRRGFGRQRLKQQQRVDELIQRIHDDTAGLTRQRHPYPIIAGKRTGMRHCGSETLFGTPPFQDHHRLGCFGRTQHLEHAPPIAGGFDVHADHFGLRVGKVIFQQLRRCDVSTVAHRNQSGKIDAAIQPTADNVGTQAAALRDDADCAYRLRPHLGKGDLATRRVDAQTVRPQQAHATGPRGCDQLLLQILAFVHFAEATGNHLRESHVALCGLQHGGNLSASNSDIGVIHRQRRIGQRLVSSESVDFCRARMNRIYRARVTKFTDTTYEMIRQRTALGRCADYGDGFGLEQRSELLEDVFGHFYMGKKLERVNTPPFLVHLFTVSRT